MIMFRYFSTCKKYIQILIFQKRVKILKFLHVSANEIEKVFKRILELESFQAKVFYRRILSKKNHFVKNKKLHQDIHEQIRTCE